jgi:hypothetical protein
VALRTARVSSPTARRWALRSAAGLALFGAAAGLTACGDTIQTQPLDDRAFGKALTATYPVYWLGRVFEGMTITRLDGDAGGAIDFAYGECIRGGQGACVPPLLLVTSPDNSFLPGGSTRRRVRIRSRSAAVSAGGRTIQIATGPVVVDIFASSAALARQAAVAMQPINVPPGGAEQAPGDPLPPPLPDTSYASGPLPTEENVGGFPPNAVARSLAQARDAARRNRRGARRRSGGRQSSSGSARTGARRRR